MSFKKNLELWRRERPLEALRLEQLDLTGYRRIIKGGQTNLKTPLGELYLEDPRKEAFDWFLKLPLQGVKLLYIYGVGLGYYYEPLKKWLKEESGRHVVFFEDDIYVMKKFLEEELAEEILEDPQVTICLVNNSEDAEGVLETLYWSFVLTPFFTSALKSYEERKKEPYEAFRYKISYSTTMKNALVDEYLRYGVGFFRNFYPNILELPSSCSGNALFGKFKNVPAILCGAGPSLEMQIPLLSSLKNRALIFAGGSSLNALLAKGVLPHFGAGIDPNPTQLLRLQASEMQEIPFFYRTRLLHGALQKIRGPRLYISGSGGYDIAEWYEEKFGLKSDFLDEGHNVVNFCTEIASRLGCNPLIYIGMDLAFTGMKAYSGGIEENVDVSEEVLLAAKDEEYRGLWRKDIYGKPILTLWKWIAEADWLSAFSKKHQEATFINATEGGIGFPDIPSIPFKTAIAKYLKKNYDLEKKITKEIGSTQLKDVTKEKVEEATLELKGSLKTCIDAIDVLREELLVEREKKETTGVSSSGRAALAETELFDEPAYQYVLDIFHQVFARVQSKRVTRVKVNKSSEMTPRALALEKIEIQLEKLQFLRNVAEANIALIDYSLNASRR